MLDSGVLRDHRYSCPFTGEQREERKQIRGGQGRGKRREEGRYHTVS